MRNVSAAVQSKRWCIDGEYYMLPRKGVRDDVQRLLKFLRVIELVCSLQAYHTFKLLPKAIAHDVVESTIELVTTDYLNFRFKGCL